MFKDYKSIAEQQTKSYEDFVAHQAYLHTTLVDQLQKLSLLLGLSNPHELYEGMKSRVSSVFEQNSKFSPVEEELRNLAQVPGNSFAHSSYYTYGRGTDPRIVETGVKGVDSNGRTLISSLLLEIAKKEFYINYRQSDTPERQATNKLNDTVIQMNRMVTNTLSGSKLYQLAYVSSATRVGATGFVHQLKALDSRFSTPEIMIDHNWIDTVFDKKLTILEYEGVRALTLSNSELEEDENRTLYNTKVLQITGTREEIVKASSYYGTRDYKPLFKVKDLVLSVSADKQHWAMGKDAVSAERTMKRRQKLAMMKQLNL